MAAAHLLPADATIAERKGRADWVHGELLHRLTVRRGASGETVWTYHLGDPELGRPFHDGGILALVPLRTAAPLQLAWPTDEGQLGSWMAQLGSVVAHASRFIAGRHQLAELLLATQPMQAGPLVADLGERYAEQVVRAFAIADALGDVALLVQVLDVLRHPGPDGTAGTALLSQAQYWADQWSYQSGRQIALPTSVAEADAVVAQVAAAAAATVPLRPRVDGGAQPADDFWDHVG
jgi:hypothetical protein